MEIRTIDLRASAHHPSGKLRDRINISTGMHICIGCIDTITLAAINSVTGLSKLDDWLYKRFIAFKRSYQHEW